MYVYLAMITYFLAYVGDGIHEKDINVQNAKMSGSNQQKEVNVGFASNNVCLAFFLLLLLLLLLF